MRQTKIDVTINTHEVGTLSVDGASDLFSFDYATAWKLSGFNISPHIPLEGTARIGAVERFLKNLLPEGRGLEQLSAFAHVSQSNTLGLIRAMGHESSGALQFGGLQEETIFRKIPIEELTERIKRRDVESITIWDQKERLSVAGVQQKLPVMIKKGTYGLGEGRYASTHILKFQKKNDLHLVLNEFSCMRLAKAIGLSVAEVEFVRFDEEPVLIVTRFDRQLHQDFVQRYHVIDGCQMLNLPPSHKYERNFGSGRDVKHIRDGATLAKLFESLALCSAPFKAQLDLLDWTLFHLVIGNSDAHAKNLSFFVDRNGISVAPIYDALCIVMHEGYEHDLAMSLGDEFGINAIRAYQLRDFAETVGLAPKLVQKRLLDMGKKIRNALVDRGMPSPIDATSQENAFLVLLQETILDRLDKLEKSAREIVAVRY